MGITAKLKILVPQNNPKQILSHTCKNRYKGILTFLVIQNIGNNINVTNRKHFNKLWYFHTMKCLFKKNEVEAPGWLSWKSV